MPLIRIILLAWEFIPCRKQLTISIIMTWKDCQDAFCRKLLVIEISHQIVTLKEFKTCLNLRDFAKWKVTVLQAVNQQD